jgi:hypothetical protein
MPDDPEQQGGTPGLLTTAGQLAGIAREALVADTGQAKLAGLVREALIAGVGLAGRVGARSSAQGSVTTTFAGVVFAGTIATQARAKLVGQFALNVDGRIAARSSATSYFLTHITLGGSIKTAAKARMLRVGQTAVAGRMTAQSKARGLVNVQLAIVRRQYGVTINTG